MINEEMTQTSNNHLSRGMFSTEGTNDEDRHITTEKFGPCHSTTSRPGETFGGSGVCLFVCNRGDTVQYHGGLRSRELGQAPMLQVFLTPRQALSSHPLKQMV